MITAEGIEAAARSHHLATVAIVEKIIGDNNFKPDVFPLVIGEGDNLRAVVFGSESKDPNPDYFNAYITLGSFSLELKIKLIYFIENEKLIKGHDLIKIYKKLSQDSQKFIQDFVVDITKNSTNHKFISDTISNHCHISFTWNAEELIKNSSMAFDKWRYSYEGLGILPWFAGYNELQKAFDARIKEIRNKKST